jgi:hypothetical protein
MLKNQCLSTPYLSNKAGRYAIGFATGYGLFGFAGTIIATAMAKPGCRIGIWPGFFAGSTCFLLMTMNRSLPLYVAYLCGWVAVFWVLREARKLPSDEPELLARRFPARQKGGLQTQGVEAFTPYQGFGKDSTAGIAPKM